MLGETPLALLTGVEPVVACDGSGHKYTSSAATDGRQLRRAHRAQLCGRRRTTLASNCENQVPGATGICREFIAHSTDRADAPRQLVPERPRVG
jgi:hypothetical protein